MGFCSAVTLAFATIFSLAAVALLAIAFSTDNWLTISVKRDKLEVFMTHPQIVTASKQSVFPKLS